jgi:hypothetical protein
MTEDEAKQKTCHKTLAPVATADGSAPWHSPAACIGSACMAWRELFESTHGKKVGYCGLAGKP